MKTRPPIASNPLADLHSFVVRSSAFTTILDFGRYLIRLDPTTGRGWFKSEISTGTFAGTMHFDGADLISTSYELPPQVRIALVRAGYKA